MTWYQFAIFAQASLFLFSLQNVGILFLFKKSKCVVGPLIFYYALLSYFNFFIMSNEQTNKKKLELKQQRRFVSFKRTWHTIINKLIATFNYNNKKDLSLHAFMKDDLDNYYKKVGTVDPPTPRTYLMTIDEFNQFSNKNKPLTVREMFAKFLMKIQGVSQEKSLAILQLYPTPTA